MKEAGFSRGTTVEFRGRDALVRLMDYRLSDSEYLKACEEECRRCKKSLQGVACPGIGALGYISPLRLATWRQSRIEDLMANTPCVQAMGGGRGNVIDGVWWDV